ncbi:MAG: SUMF1/EgtB/PvdO family nonheme iron enzyme [Planctomycetia bacterium]
MEWIFIRLFTSRSRWTVPQRQMMTVAAQKHLVRLGTIGSILLLAVALTFRVIAHRDAQSSVDKLTRAGAEDLTEVFPEIDSQQVYVAPLLRNVILDAREEGSETGGENSRGKALLHARLALVGWEASHVDWLVEQLLEHSDLEYVEPLRSRLHPFAARVAPRLLSVLRDSQESASRRFRAVLGLVGLPQEFWRDELQSADLEFVAGHLTSMFAETQPLLRRLLEPIRTSLLPSLETLFDADHVSAGMQINAAMALHEYAGDNPQLLTRLVTRATAAQMAILFPENDEKKTNLEWDDLVAVLQKQPRENFRQKERVRLGLRRANAAIAMLRLGDRHEYFDVFRVANDPEALSQFVARCRECGVTVEDLLESLESACAKRVAEMGSASRDSAHRIYGLLLALGNYSLESISDARRAAVLEMLEGFYEQDPAAVVHSASGWLLRHWGHATVVERLDQVEVPYDPTGKRDWFRMRLALRPHAQEPTETPKPKQVHSLTFVVFQPGEYRLGSPDFEGGEEERDKAEVPRIVRITRPFAICDRELTFALFDLFDGGVWRSRTTNEHGWDLTGDSPACGISWLVAVEFCRWLTSEYYGEDEALQSHASNIPITDPAQGQRLLYIKPGDMHLDRRGFRMATESEWEVAARGGQSTAYAFGGDAGLLADYGWYWGNSQKRPQATAKKRPSISGLYDTHGNLYEWTFDGRELPQQPMPTVLIDYTGIQDSGSRILRSGSWSYSEDRCRSAYRDDDDPNSNGTSFGFRLVLTPSALPIPSPQH